MMVAEGKRKKHENDEAQIIYFVCLDWINWSCDENCPRLAAGVTITGFKTIFVSISGSRLQAGVTRTFCRM